MDIWLFIKCGCSPTRSPSWIPTRPPAEARTSSPAERCSAPLAHPSVGVRRILFDVHAAGVSVICCSSLLHSAGLWAALFQADTCSGGLWRAPFFDSHRSAHRALATI
jgi:hypothetical protein